MEVNGVQGNDALALLSPDDVFPIAIGLKPMFEKVMATFDAHKRPSFTEVQSGVGGIRFMIKMDVSDLPSITGERVWYALVEGEPMVNHDDAEASAVNKAFKFLESNHLLRIVDFSSMIVQRVVGNDSHGLLSDAIGAFEKVLLQWDVALSKCDKIVEKLEGKENNDNIYLPRTSRGLVYGSLSDYLFDQINLLHHRTSDAKSGLTEARYYLSRYKLFLEENAAKLSNEQSYDVTLAPTFILDYVMSFFGLMKPEYVSSLDCHRFVESTVSIEFPLMDKFPVSGKIEIVAKSFSTVQAKEEAAYKALLFIEDNFNTKVVDYNYPHRKKALKEEKNISAKLSKILDLADSVKMMFGELITLIEGQRLHFSFDPSVIFEGPMSSAMIEAYHHCSRGIAGLADELANCYSACAQEFASLNKLAWKVVSCKANAPF